MRFHLIYTMLLFALSGCAMSSATIGLDIPDNSVGEYSTSAILPSSGKEKQGDEPRSLDGEVYAVGANESVPTNSANLSSGQERRCISLLFGHALCVAIPEDHVRHIGLFESNSKAEIEKLLANQVGATKANEKSIATAFKNPVSWPFPSGIASNASNETAQSNSVSSELPLTKGNAAYYVPARMESGKPSRVDLWIDHTKSVDELKDLLAKQLNLDRTRINVKIGRTTDSSANKSIAGEVIGKKAIWVGKRMSARLRGGDDFDVDPKDAVEKSLEAEGRAEWIWLVTPKHASDAGLTLVIDAWINVGGAQDSFPSIEEVVLVPPSFGDRVQAILEKIFHGGSLLNDLIILITGGSGISAVLLFVARWIRGKRANKDPFLDKPAIQKPLPIISPPP